MEELKELAAVKQGSIHCLTIVGQIEGHQVLPEDAKATKYEHILPLLAAIEESEEIRGLLILLNTMGGDVEAGLAIAEIVFAIHGNRHIASFFVIFYASSNLHVLNLSCKARCPKSRATWNFRCATDILSHSRSIGVDIGAFRRNVPLHSV